MLVIKIAKASYIDSKNYLKSRFYQFIIPLPN
jgi:hypothetical protein